MDTPKPSDDGYPTHVIDVCCCTGSHNLQLAMNKEPYSGLSTVTSRWTNGETEVCASTPGAMELSQFQMYEIPRIIKGSVP